MNRPSLNPLCYIGLHRDKLATAGSSIVGDLSRYGWGNGLIDVCHDCGRVQDHNTKQQLTSPKALAAGQKMRDRSPFARLVCFFKPHDLKSHSAIFPEVSHWDECTRCDLRTNER